MLTGSCWHSPAQTSDNYGSQFPRYHTRHFDATLWTTDSGAPETGTPVTWNEVLRFDDPVLGTRISAVWFEAADVDYEDTDYTFGAGGQICNYLFGKVCDDLDTPEDFPGTFLTSAYQRAYMNEDDWAPGYFSTRSGDWEGDVRTYNFSSNAVQTLYTRVDGNNHAVVSSDRVFERGGLRRINFSTVLQDE